ncbi:MAG: MarR family transcriptional regulator [Chitinispirillaceae bacterium]
MPGTDCRARAGIDRSTVAGTIRMLESQGFIERVVNPRDQRAYRVVLTQIIKLYYEYNQHDRRWIL